MGLTKAIRNAGEVLNMNILTLNKRYSKLKDGYFKMPNISYCHRCGAC